MAMENFLRKAREAREFLTPVLKNSKFLNEGILTPEEFVKAGSLVVVAPVSSTSGNICLIVLWSACARICRGQPGL